MMRIDHFALWCDNIEQMRIFYTTYFDGVSNDMYHNSTKRYSSYFISFGAAGCRIELMNRPDITEEVSKRGFVKGIAHFDIEVGNQEAVDRLTLRLKNDGYRIASEPRKTGDGYYEAAILDPEGNYVEISAKQ